MMSSFAAVLNRLSPKKSGSQYQPLLAEEKEIPPLSPHAEQQRKIVEQFTAALELKKASFQTVKDFFDSMKSTSPAKVAARQYIEQMTDQNQEGNADYKANFLEHAKKDFTENPDTLSAFEEFDVSYREAKTSLDELESYLNKPPVLQDKKFQQEFQALKKQFKSYKDNTYLDLVLQVYAKYHTTVAECLEFYRGSLAQRPRV